MGLFGRKKADDDVLNDWSGTDQPLGIDFSAYELSSLSEDVQAIIDLPAAIRQTAKWGLGIPAALIVISWIVFSGRMSSWILVPFVLGVGVLSLLGAVAIGGFFVARKRLNRVAQATDRVVGVVGEMHGDVVQLREGHAQTSVKQVAVGLLENAIFPIVFDTVEGLAASASGPFSAITSRATSAPMKLVQKSVVAAVGRLPDHELGQIVDDAAGAAPEFTQALTELHDSYQRVAGQIEDVVDKVSKTTLTSVLSVAVISLIPMFIWLAIGWAAS